MPKFRKKPAVIEAVQFTYPPSTECLIFCGEGLRNVRPGAVGTAEITTIHGETAIVRERDWIAAEPVPGRFYPIKPDIFEATYERVED